MKDILIGVGRRIATIAIILGFGFWFIPASPALAVEVDKNALIGKVTMAQVEKAVHTIRLMRFTCDRVDRAVLGGSGMIVVCNDWRYAFDIKDHGGRWLAFVL